MKHYIAEGAAGSLGFEEEFVINFSSLWRLIGLAFFRGRWSGSNRGLELD